MSELHCECGCGQSVPKARYASWQTRFIHGHNARGHRKQLRWSEEDCGFETPCWVWQLSLKPQGYGEMTVTDANGRRKVYAHRYYYEQAHGPIPEGLHLDHLCRNPACVNPAHLEPVTPRENVRRGKRTKLTPKEVEEIRTAALGGNELRKDIAARFGITPTHVAFIANGKTWADGARRRSAGNLA